MSIKARIAVAVAVPLLAVVAPGAAFAGEVKGPPGDGFATGDFNVIATYVANSICAFSGLNAYHDGKEPVFPVVQSYGMGIRQMAQAGMPLPHGIPGDACNGHSGELAGGGTPQP
jgi:hypothetical protein